MLIVTALVKTRRTLKGRMYTPLDPIVGLLNHCNRVLSVFYFTIRAQISHVCSRFQVTQACMHARAHTSVSFDRYI